MTETNRTTGTQAVSTLIAENSLADAALDYAARGIPVFPCHAVRPDGSCTCPKRAACSDAGKHPLSRHGVRDATCDPTIITAWWWRWSWANLAGATGIQSDVLDIDGIDWEAWQERTGYKLPPTWRARTGSGGEHWHFQPAPGLGNGVKRVPFADSRGQGGYVLLPPSLHRSGRRYEWIVPPGAVPLAPWPADLLAALMPPPRPAPSLAPRPSGVTGTIPPSLAAVAERGAGQGQRNNLLFWLSCRLREHGADDHQALDILGRFAAACTPPLTTTETTRTWASSFRAQGYSPDASEEWHVMRRRLRLPRARWGQRT